MVALIMSGAAPTQSAQLEKGPPGVESFTLKSLDRSGRPARVVDAKGREFTVTYDAAGRPRTFRAPRPDALDVRAISYLPDGRIAIVSFGNRYALLFRYRSDGTQEVADSLGTSIVRRPVDASHYEMDSGKTPGGPLISTLRRLETLLSHFPGIKGLSR
jgi:YD repeat-containing protein